MMLLGAVNIATDALSGFATRRDHNRYGATVKLRLNAAALLPHQSVHKFNAPTPSGLAVLTTFPPESHKPRVSV